MEQTEILVKSTLDGSLQPSLFYPASTKGRPLLVGLHTWSNTRTNQIRNLVPVAERNDFNLLLPEFRGPNLTTNPKCTEACGSKLAMQDIKDAIDYLIEKGDKAFLYGHDTGYFYDEVFDYLKDNKVYLNGLTLDCCYASLPISDEGAHMGYPNVERVLKRLEDNGTIDSKTKKVINHFSHNVNPLQEVIEEESKHLGVIVSYDGMVVEV